MKNETTINQPKKMQDTDVISAKKYLTDTKSFNRYALSLKVVLILATIFAVINELYKYIVGDSLLSAGVSAIFVSLIIVLLAAATIYMLNAMKDLKKLPELFNVENARQVLNTKESLTDIESVGNQYMISSEHTKLLLNKKTTAITVTDETTQSFYQQEIIYFDKDKFAINFQDSGINVDDFLDALPVDYLQMFTGLDAQIDTLSLTESDYTKVNQQYNKNK